MTNSVQAKVKYPCKEVATKFGRRINVVFETETGELVTKWGKPEDELLPNLKKNQQVSLSKENNKVIVFPLSKTAIKEVTEKITKQETVNETFKSMLLKKAKELTKHYNDCDKLVRSQISEYKSEDSIRAITTTVFLQSVRSLAGAR